MIGCHTLLLCLVCRASLSHASQLYDVCLLFLSQRGKHVEPGYVTVEAVSDTRMQVKYVTEENSAAESFWIGGEKSMCQAISSLSGIRRRLDTQQCAELLVA